MMDRPPSGTHRWRRALGFVSGYRDALAVVLVLTLVVGAAGALEPLLLKFVIDELTLDATAERIVLGLGILLAVGLLRELVAALNNKLTWKTRLSVQYGLLSATVERLHSLPLSFHQEGGVGATMTKLDRGVQGVVAGLSELAFNVLPSLVYLGMSLSIMIELDGRVALVVMAFVPLPALIGAFAAGEQTRRERHLMDRWVRIYSRFNEVLSGILTVKTFAMEDAEKKRFLTDVDETNRLVIKGVATDSWVGGLKSFVVVLARIAALVAGAVLVARGQMTVGTVVAFLGYIGGLFGPVQGLVGIYQTLRRTSVALDTVLSILDAQDALGDAPDAEEVARVEGAVTFRNLHFSYDGRTPILRGIDLEVARGEVVAIVGPSGSGKTTLMSLLQRLYDPTAGAVLVDGKDLRRLKQRSLRHHIGVVLQDSLLFNDSVRANVAYGRPEASMDDVVAATRAAHAHDFIAKLPQAYETIVGERGSHLSTGQRQRLVIARALLKDPPILILDEATSALDAETEALVQDAFAQLMRGRTTFIIAHRLSTVTQADRVVVLKQGRIVEAGRHEQLLARGGTYSTMVRLQATGLRFAEALER